jgi:hypothetical protein
MGAPDLDRDRTDNVDDQFRALLEGLRVTLPGVQLITAFLLTLPLQSSFSELVRAERVAYYVAFGAALLGSVLLMAPSSHQRVRANDVGSVARRSSHHLAVAVRLTIAGSALFALALVAVAYLVSSLVLGTGIAVGVTATVAVVCLWSWFYVPMVSFRSDR